MRRLSRRRLTRVSIELVITRFLWLVEVRVKSQTEEPALIVIRGDFDQAVGDIQKWSGQEGAILQDPNRSSLLDNKEPAAPIAGILQINRGREAARNGLEFDLDVALLDQRQRLRLA